MASRAWISNTSESGAESLHLVAPKFMTKVEDCHKTVAKVEETMRKDRWVSLDDLCVSIPEVSRTTIYRILTDKLQYRKVYATWVP